MGQGDDAGARRPRCPTCARPVTRAGNPARPFCSVRCKLIDLGVWLDGRYRMPAEPLPVATAAIPSPDDE